METLKNIFTEIGEFLVKAYGMYSNFIHSIFPAELGDLIVLVLNLALAFVLVKAVSSYAFSSKGE